MAAADALTRFRRCLQVRVVAIALAASSAQLVMAAPTWLREPALSPDGSSLAFRADGDLFVMRLDGGVARLLRGTDAHEWSPVWLSDGRRIAFAANPFGNYDVFVMAADGSAEPTRLTWHSRNESPVAASPDGRSLLVRTGRLDLSTSPAVYPMQLGGREDLLPERPWEGLSRLPIEGGLPRLLVEPSSVEGTWNDTGTQLIFSVRPSNEYVYRKHERSPATWDLWMSDTDGEDLRRLTTFDGHDTTPRWSAADGRIYFLSERSGSLNVWRMSTAGDSDAEQVTHHTGDPVRGLTVSKNGLVAYSFRGELYVGHIERRFRKLAVRLPARERRADSAPRDLSAAVRQAVRVPRRAEIAVVARGEVYAVDPVSGGRRGLFLGEEGVKSWPSFSADGRRLLVVRNRGNASDLLLAELADGSASWLDGTRQPQTRTLAVTKADVIIRAALSPDGSQAAFTTGRALRIVDVTDGSMRQVLEGPAGLEPYDEPFVWHPAGEHLAIQVRNLRRDASEIAILSTQDGSLLNVSESGFHDVDPHWTADGRALVWTSDRDGLRAFLAADSAADAYALRLHPSHQHLETSGGRDRWTPARSEDLARWLRMLRADADLIALRRERLTGSSAVVRATAVAPDGRFVLQLREVAGQSELWRAVRSPGREEAVEERVASLPMAPLLGERPAGVEAKSSSVPSVEIGAGELDALVTVDGAAYWIDLRAGTATQVALRDVPPDDPAVVQRWLFEHVVRTVERVYYRPEHLPRVRWQEHVRAHRGLLRGLRDPASFAELMNELLGELQASHTYFHHEPLQGAARSGSLGVIYDPAHGGAGWRIAEVLPGSPLPADIVRAGDVITKMNEAAIPSRSDPAQWLLGTVGIAVTLQVESADGVTRRVKVVPISNAEEATAAYRRWVAWQRRQADRLSGGRLGYVHMASMREAPFRALVSEVLGRSIDKEGIVLDTRFNQGGWMHEPLLAFFSAPQFFQLKSVGRIYASEPNLRAGRPTVLLVNAANYSNGSEVPRVFQEHGIARLVGEPHAGTGLGGHSEPLPFPEYSYSVAHDTCLTVDGQYWENTDQYPDEHIAADRRLLRTGRDTQLEGAVSVLLRQIDLKNSTNARSSTDGRAFAK